MYFVHDLFQTSNLIINLDHDDWILADDGKTLLELGFGGCISLIRDISLNATVLDRKRN
jgi:hypothetical protein